MLICFDIRDSSINYSGYFIAGTRFNKVFFMEFVADGHLQFVADGHSQSVADGHSQSVVDGHSQSVADGHSQSVADGHSQFVADGHSQLLLGFISTVWFSLRSVSSVKRFKDM